MVLILLLLPDNALSTALMEVSYVYDLQKNNQLRIPLKGRRSYAAQEAQTQHLLFKKIVLKVL